MTSSSGGPGEPLPAETHLGRTALRVGDLEETIEFYRTVVGLPILDRTGERATLGVDGRPMLVLETGGRDRKGDAAGLFHNAFRVPSRRALGDALGRVREHWHLDGASEHRVSEALYLSDPEGNGVEIYRDYPREDWPVAADGTVRMTTEPLDLDAVAAAAGGGGDRTPGDGASEDGTPGDGAPGDTVPAGTVLGHVHLEVTSLAAFREFYVGTLGFEERAQMTGASFVAAGGYHHHVGANVWNRKRDAAGGDGLAWFEVVVPGSDALAAVRERLETQGLSVTTGEFEGDGTEHDEGFAVSDPDGIELRLRAEPTEIA